MNSPSPAPTLDTLFERSGLIECPKHIPVPLTVPPPSPVTFVVIFALLEVMSVMLTIVTVGMVLFFSFLQAIKEKRNSEISPMSLMD